MVMRYCSNLIEAHIQYNGEGEYNHMPFDQYYLNKGFLFNERPFIPIPTYVKNIPVSVSLLPVKSDEILYRLSIACS